MASKSKKNVQTQTQDVPAVAPDVSPVAPVQSDAPAAPVISNKLQGVRLSERALLVRLSISMPGNARTDAKVTKETLESHGMAEKMGRFTKVMYPPESFAAVQNIAVLIRKTLELNTLPWTNESRVLPTAHFSGFTDAIRPLMRQFDEAADKFCLSLPSMLDWAKEKHNGTFDPSLYPSAEQLRAKFACSVSYAPVPEKEDFRCNLTPEQLQEVQAEVDTMCSSAAKEAQKELWQRLTQPLSELARRLSDPDVTFTKTALQNLTNLADLIPQLSIADDGIDRFCQEIKELASVNPKVLRIDAPSREKAAKAAQSILDRMASYA